MTTELVSDLIAEAREQWAVPTKLLQDLGRRDALPRWMGSRLGARRDWLEALNRAVTEEGWPDRFKRAGAALLGSGLNLAVAAIGQNADAVLMPASTPGYLRSLFDILVYPLVKPGSNEPETAMVLDGHRMDEAARRLEVLLGMLADTSYIDAPGEEDAFGGAVTPAARFLYYHELAHLVAVDDGVTGRPAWVLPAEEYLAEELVADQYAFAFLAYELRSHPELQPVGYSGIALALSFMAAREFAACEYEGHKHRTKNATLRMERLLFWGRQSVRFDGITEEAVTWGQLIWDILRGLLARVQAVPSPVNALLGEALKAPRSTWRATSTQLLVWCAFGDRARLLGRLQQIFAGAVAQASTEPGAARFSELMDFILEDTAELEPELGLRSALGL